MSQTSRQMEVRTDDWALATVEAPLPQYRVRWREPLLVDLPCPAPISAAPTPTDFECEVMETAEMARYVRVSPQAIRTRASRCAWGVAVSATLAIGLIATPVAFWLGTVPVAFAAGFGWQWAVFSAAASRLERGTAVA